MFKKGLRLTSAGIVQVGIDTTALHETTLVKFGFSVPYDVKFFRCQG